MNLPEEFIGRMKKLLGDEYGQFISSYKYNYHRGLRVNTLKIDVDEFMKISPFELEPIPWVKEGFYINEDDLKPGKHPYYHCGLYYVQEPSAMLPVIALDPRPGERILDVSAAPGGKSTQIGARLQGKGFLVANDISPKRVKALTKNIEVFGIKNSLITNDTPENLASVFQNYFDKILVDAPCSGEGMFRKDPKGVKSWSSFSVEQCCSMQREILASIPSMLKPGGRVVYSTCTFSPEENEGTIQWFLNQFPEFEIEEIEGFDDIDRGRPEWIGAPSYLGKARRAWPHKVRGEGHFIAKLRKKDGVDSNYIPFKLKDGNVESYIEFSDEILKGQFQDNLHIVKNRIFLVPKDMPDITGLRIANIGLNLGEINRNRFNPSQALAMVLKKDDVDYSIDLDSNSIEPIKYLKGETLIVGGEKRWRLVTIDGYSVGWGKQTKDNLKNYYRPEWRMV